ncbi:MAG: glycosyltransferase [Nitrospira sp.]|nr:glycosyltransferase [Nitrospira sp.]
MSSMDVIVPCYRYGRFLRECVESVLAESVLDVRVLIIDDASPDNTAEVGGQLAKEDFRVTFLRHAKNKGHIATYNEGIEWVSADYMLLLSADDYLLPNALRRATNLMNEHPEVGFTFGRAIELRDGESVLQEEIEIDIDRKGWRILSGLEFIELSGSHNIVHTPAAVVRTELQKRLGGYRAELPHTGDMEMWLRFAAHSAVGKVEACQAVYRRHNDNMSLNYYKREEKYLPDIQQRKAALDCFFKTCSHVLPNAQRLHRKLSRALGCETIGCASAAFNAGKMDVSEELLELALSVYPQIKRSLPWAKLACKRGMGVRTWQTLQPICSCLRRWGLH